MDEVFYGKMIIGEILNITPPEKVQVNEKLQYPEMNAGNIRFVHYEDCQQLIIWLPASGMDYENFSLIDQKRKKVVYEQYVKDILQGSIQIITDSLPFPPGEYELRIRHKSGMRHIVKLEKLPEGVEKIEEVSAGHVTDSDAESIVYKDGLGNILPDEDLILRERLINEIKNKFLRKLSYRGNVRAGYVIYTEGDINLEFETEMGGGNCMFFVNIPTEKQWETKTGIAIERREDIIWFVATGTQRDQASSCRFEIRDHEIVYYKK